MNVDPPRTKTFALWGDKIITFQIIYELAEFYITTIEFVPVILDFTSTKSFKIFFKFFCLEAAKIYIGKYTRVTTHIYL